MRQLCLFISTYNLEVFWYDMNLKFTSGILFDMAFCDGFLMGFFIYVLWFI